MTTRTYSGVRAVYHNGILDPLEPLRLPEGAQVEMEIQLLSASAEEHKNPLLYPTRLIPAERLEDLTALIAVGGDALADSEALYDADCP